jgi:hypothetical protein
MVLGEAWPRDNCRREIKRAAAGTDVGQIPWAMTSREPKPGHVVAAGTSALAREKPSPGENCGDGNQERWQLKNDRDLVARGKQ